MAALTTNTPRAESINSRMSEYGVAASQHIYRGSFVGLNPAGYLKTFVPGDLFVGIAEEEFDNSGSSSTAGGVASPGTGTGRSLCKVWIGGDYQLTLSSVALTDVGRPVYATDDNTLSLTGHPDAYVGRVLRYVSSNTCIVQMREFGEKAPNGQGSIELVLTGHETFTATGATAGTAIVGAFELKSILGPGFTANDAEDGGILLSFDATAEVALASVRTTHDILPVDKGLTFEADIVVSDKGDNAALDIDWGFGTALTTNSEASIDHADMVNLAAFHMDGNSDNINVQSDDNSTDVANVDTTIDNDSTTDVAKKFKIIIRPSGSVEFWINGVRALSTTTFAVASTANLSPFINMEKTSDDTTAALLLRNLRIGAGCAAA